MKSHRIAGCFFVVLCLFAMPAAACNHFVSVGVGPDLVICVGTTVTIDVLYTHCYYYCSTFTYSWSATGDNPPGTGDSYSCSFTYPGEYWITVTATCAGEAYDQASVEVFVVGVGSIENDRDAACWNDPNGIVFTAIADPNGPLDCLQWQGRRRDDPNEPWSDWGTVSLSVQDPGPNDVRLSGTPGYFQLRTRNGSDTKSWAESGVVTVCPSCAHPTNFQRHRAWTTPGSGFIHFMYTWESTSDNIFDLADCLVGERVDYPGNDDPYEFPSPMIGSATNPTIVEVSGNNQPLSGTKASLSDIHSPPLYFQSPYHATSFSANQKYRYRCQCVGCVYHDLLTGLSISRSIFWNENQWIYKISKDGLSNTMVLPGQ